MLAHAFAELSYEEPRRNYHNSSTLREVTNYAYTTSSHIS